MFTIVDDAKPHRKTANLALSYWVLYRRHAPRDNHAQEVFVCCRDGCGAEAVEMAFKLGFGCAM